MDRKVGQLKGTQQRLAPAYRAVSAQAVTPVWGSAWARGPRGQSPRFTAGELCVRVFGGAGGEVLTEIEREHDGDSKLGHFGDL